MGQGGGLRFSSIQWTAHASATTIQHVSVNHGRPHIFVSEQFLDCANVISVFQQMSGETVTEGVVTRRFVDADCSHRIFHRLLQHPFADVMSLDCSGNRIPAALRSWEHLLPTPLFVCVRVLAIQCEWKMDFAVSIS